MVVRGHAGLSVVRQCDLLCISRSGLYYEPAGESAEALALMRVIDEAFLKVPFYGSRQMARHLVRQGHAVGRKRVRRLMAMMGLAAIYQRPRTSTPNPEHRIHPYLLRDVVIDRPNQVWCTDMTYIAMRRGFMYLVAVMDWASDGSCPGVSRTAWRRISASRLFRRRWRVMAGRRYSTPIKAANLPAPALRVSWRGPAYGSAWTGAAVGWTMCSSSGFGGR